jgi:hypothetical protein
MSAPLWFENLLAYSLQIAVLAAAGIFIPQLLRLRAPRQLLVFGQCLLAGCLPALALGRALAPHRASLAGRCLHNLPSDGECGGWGARIPAAGLIPPAGLDPFRHTVSIP